MTAITEISVGHFSGAKAVTGERAGEDTRSLEELIRELQQAKNSGAISQLVDFQDTAATLNRGYVAAADGEIVSAQAFAEVTAAAGEDMAIDITINGTTALTGAISIDDAAGILVQEGTLDTGAIAFSKGDKIAVDLVYTPGGTPTPMTGTSVAVGLRLSE